jgi:hypothetical protein
VEIEEVAPVKKGRKPREKKIIKKLATYTTTKDDTPSSSMPTSIIAPPPSLVSPTPFEMIDTARSHCPPTLLSIPPNAFAYHSILIGQQFSPIDMVLSLKL